MSDYKIYANHAHLFPKNTKPNGDKDCLKVVLDNCEIEKAVCFAPFQNQMEMYAVSATQNRNSWLANEIKNENQLVGFGTVNFDEGNLEDQVKEIAELGLLGIKIHPAYHFECSLRISCEHSTFLFNFIVSSICIEQVLSLLFFVMQ